MWWITWLIGSKLEWRDTKLDEAHNRQRTMQFIVQCHVESSIQRFHKIITDFLGQIIKYYGFFFNDL